MNQDNSILAFPAAAAAGEVPQHVVLPGAAAPVIDLQARRRAVAGDDGACVSQEQSNQLSSGEIWDAINDGRLVVHYQPQYDMHSGKTVAAEALVRLTDADGHLVYPDRFIDTAEQRDSIVALGHALIEQVCADLAACRTAGYALQRVAINLSAHQLNVDTTLLMFIDQMVAAYGLSYADLEFELTERQRLTPQCEGLAALNALAERGARIVIDDFGIGYSSIVYLAELPVNAFKLDRALVGRLPESRSMRTLVESLLALAESLELEVIAEGIETDGQNEYLVRAGCLIAQGYAYAKPMNIDDLQAFMTDTDWGRQGI